MAGRKLDRNRLSICCWYLSILIILSVFGFVAWLSLTPKDPRFKISVHAQFPSVNSRNHSIESNNSLLFDIEISNPNKRMGIYYSGIDLKLYSGGVVGKNSSRAFYQGQKESNSTGLVIHANQEFWRGMSGRIVEFMVRVETSVRFRIIRWNTKPRDIGYEAYFSNADINPNGTVSIGNFKQVMNAQEVKTRNW